MLPTSLSTAEAGKGLVKHPPTLIHALTTSEANLITVNLDKVIDVTRYSSKIKLIQMTVTVVKIAVLDEKGQGSPVMESHRGS